MGVESGEVEWKEGGMGKNRKGIKRWKGQTEGWALLISKDGTCRSEIIKLYFIYATIKRKSREENILSH